MPLDLAAIKARLAAVQPYEVRDSEEWFECPLCEGDGEVKGSLRSTGTLDSALFACGHGDGLARAEAWVEFAPADIAALIAEVEALGREVERLRALLPAPPKPLERGEIRRHRGTLDIDGTSFDVDFINIGQHEVMVYYPTENAEKDHCSGFSDRMWVRVNGNMIEDTKRIQWWGWIDKREFAWREMVERLIFHVAEHDREPTPEEWETIRAGLGVSDG